MFVHEGGDKMKTEILLWLRAVFSLTCIAGSIFLTYYNILI